ncbi:MAG: endopeptidase La [Polyangiaceae bacterium]|nr:endopeptidase La [Polyangiaceae bacterium]
MSLPSAPPGPPERVGILPLRNSVLFPMSIIPINVGRPRSVRLVEDLAAREGALVGVLSQRSGDVLEPTFEDLAQTGTLARVVKIIRLGAANYSVVLNGIGRFRVERELGLEPFMRAEVTRLAEPAAPSDRAKGLAIRLRDSMRRLLEFLPNLPRETSGILDNVREPGALADLIASNFPEEHAPVPARQAILDALDVETRVELALALVERQLEIHRTRSELGGLVHEELTRSQRDLVLREQIRSIRDELGESAEDDEIEQLRERIARAELPDEALRQAKKQLARLAGMQAQSAEYQLTRNYVEWLADLPWAKTTPDRVDVGEVRRCLEEDHHGLEQVKRRIVEYTAVRQLRRDKKGPILLFVGPPGVGKTSLGRSIARAMGRRYARIALGGVRDEAEIRGHRRTYVGALPGRILQALKKVGTRNPVLVLDEVDKMGADLRGDPAAALLEALDPEQNDTFVDHYVDLPFDLSEIVFLATANSRSEIPEALRDRMEIIEVPGYTRTEKRAIARSFLAPKQLREHGLTSEILSFPDEVIDLVVDQYTREAGVRGLEREIAALCRAVAVRLAEGEVVRGEVLDRERVERVLGVPRHRPEVAERHPVAGVATGLGTNAAGGDLLFIEVTRMPGKGEIRVTGNLRTVMKESADTALSFVRAHATELCLAPDWLDKIDLHLHVPRAGSAEDAASVGLPMFVAVTSLLLGAPARTDVAVTGELTLRGAVLPVGGVKAKVLAAHRAGIRELVLPARNERDLEEVPAEVLRELSFRFVHRVDQVLPLVLLDAERPAEDSPDGVDAASP